MRIRKATRDAPSRLRRVSRRALSILLVVGFGYGVTPLLGSALRPEACSSWGKRHVPVEDLDGEALVHLRRETRVVRVPSYMAAWPRDAIALPGVVAVSDKRMLSGRDTLLWHEMIHQHQYRRDGAALFLVRYVADWHLGLLNGCNYNTAYETIGYEIETHALLREMRIDLGGNHSEEFERIAMMLEDPTLQIPRIHPRPYNKPVTMIPPVQGGYERTPPTSIHSWPPPPAVTVPARTSDYVQVP